MCTYYKMLVTFLSFPQNDDGTPMRTFLSSDGEAVILQAAITEEIIANFRDSSIDYAKGPPSATSSHQSADRQSVFAEGHHHVEKQIKNNLPIVNPLLDTNLHMAFNALCLKFPSMRMSAAYKNMLVFGALHITHALANHALTPEKVRRGYTICGQQTKVGQLSESLQRFPNLAESTVDYDKVMSECYTKMSIANYEIMVNAIPQMIAMFRTGARPTDEFMDNLNIPKLEGRAHKPRDAASTPLWQQHAQVVTSEGTSLAFYDYLRARVEANDPAMKALKKQAADDEKELQRLMAAEIKKNEADLKKQLAQRAKAEDKAYLEGLSFVERKAEVARRKIVSTAERAQLQLDKENHVVALLERVRVEAARQADDPFYAPRLGVVSNSGPVVAEVPVEDEEEEESTD